MITTIKHLWSWLNQPACELRIRIGKRKANQIPPEGMFMDRHGTIHVLGKGQKETA
tara:strand:+ start:931 stop:1098 length:168 start_codon:yes stop_codon:yes gene_type:complete